MPPPPPLGQLENVETFSRACHAFGDGSIPHIEIVPQKVSENPAENGVADLLCKSSPLRGLKTSQRFKGMLPLRCLPLWGREGVTLITIEDIKRITR